MMIRLLSIFTFFLLLSSCDRKPFVEHKVKTEKLNNDCRGLSQSFKITANFGGERFEFEKCLPANFDKSQVKSFRQGDTVVVQFPQPTSASAMEGHKVILDIDSYPVYRVLTIDNDSYNITVTGN